LALLNPNACCRKTRYISSCAEHKRSYNLVLHMGKTTIVCLSILESGFCLCLHIVHIHDHAFYNCNPRSCQSSTIHNACRDQEKVTGLVSEREGGEEEEEEEEVEEEEEEEE
jgi:hypothetical protein